MNVPPENSLSCVIYFSLFNFCGTSRIMQSSSIIQQIFIYDLGAAVVVTITYADITDRMYICV